MVTSDGAVYTWGSGAHGATGLGSTENTFEPSVPNFNGFDLDELSFRNISCAKHCTALVTQSGQVLVTGDNSKH